MIYSVPAKTRYSLIYSFPTRYYPETTKVKKPDGGIILQGVVPLFFMHDSASVHGSKWIGKISALLCLRKGEKAGNAAAPVIIHNAATIKKAREKQTTNLELVWDLSFGEKTSLSR